MDSLHHPFQDGIEQLPHFLGVPVREELHGALAVGEEHGDLLALPFESRLGRQDLLDQVLRRVGLRRGESWWGSGDTAQRLAAASAELPAGRHDGTTRWASEIEPRPAFLAEAHACAVL